MRSRSFYWKPMVIGAFLFNWGGVTYGIYTMNNILGIITGVISSISLLLFCKGKKLFILAGILFMGLVNVYTYFNLFLPYDIYDNLTVVEDHENFILGEIRGRSVYVEGKIHYPLGTEIEVFGDFKEKRDLQWGNVGTYKVFKSSKKRNTMFYYSQKIKGLITKRTRTLLTDRGNGYINAMCLGNKEFMIKEDMEYLKNLGMLHLMAVSGLHMVILLGVITFFIRRKWISLAVVVFYVFFIGAPASAMRSVIMLVVYTTSISVMKSYDKLSALSFASILILIYKPSYIFNVSYHLSFLALLGIILFTEKFRDVFSSLPKKIGSAMAVMMGAQVFVLPYCMMVFEELNIGIVLGNVLILPMGTILVGLGFITMVILMIPLIGGWFAAVYDLSVYLFSRVIFLTDKCSLRVLKVHPNCAILYLLVFSFLMYYGYMKKRSEGMMSL